MQLAPEKALLAPESEVSDRIILGKASAICTKKICLKLFR
jgi:hypothetical protein